MKVELIEQTIDEYNMSYKFKPFKYCCDKLENNDMINLVNEYDANDYNSDLVPMFALIHNEHFWEWGEEYDETYYYKINHCPFCGELIEISIIGKEDVSEIVNRLEEERKKVWKKYCRTDSKKKEAELRKVVHDLDEKTNYFYNLAEYKNLEEI